MKILLTLVIVIIVAIAAGLAFIYSGIYDVSAMRPEGKFSGWILSTTMDYSVKHHAKGITVPPLTDTATVAAGFQSFSRMCVGCHGAPGVQKRGRGFNPEPPDLSEGVSDLSDAEIFWIIKNGIKMTAMPAYGPNKTDDDLWKITAFVRLLPKMTTEQYQAYKDALGDQPE